MDTIEAIHTRRSIRDFTPEVPERSLIEALIGDAAQAPIPFAGAPPPWVFVVIEGRERLAGYGERAKAFARADRPGGPGLGWTDNPDFKVFWNAPVLVLVASRIGDAGAPWSCCRAAQTLLLAAHARGLGSCWVGAPLAWLANAEVRTELGVPDGFEVAAAIILGHPAEQPAPRAPEAPAIVWS
jgi:nitroreductase